MKCIKTVGSILFGLEPIKTSPSESATGKGCYEEAGWESGSGI